VSSAVKCGGSATVVANFCQNESSASNYGKSSLATHSFRVARSARRPAAGPWRSSQQRVPTVRGIHCAKLGSGVVTAQAAQHNYFSLSLFVIGLAPVRSVVADRFSVLPAFRSRTPGHGGLSTLRMVFGAIALSPFIRPNSATPLLARRNNLARIGFKAARLRARERSAAAQAPWRRALGKAPGALQAGQGAMHLVRGQALAHRCN
jgi:hypothetical protein